jgi:hypothetical protein
MCAGELQLLSIRFYYPVAWKYVMEVNNSNITLVLVRRPSFTFFVEKYSHPGL